MTEKVLQLENVSKKIGQKEIIHNISFEVEKGEVFGLLGPNGAGKTTIIRSIVKLIKKTNGDVHISGINVDDNFKDAIKHVGAIIENPEFYMYMSGLNNLKQFARMSRKEISDKQIMDVVKQVKLEHAITSKVKTYSLGMRQRLGLAQALIHQPDLLILDEPTNGLDPQGMREFRELIRELAQRGTSVLISSHLLSEIQQITDRFAIINQGKLTHIERITDLEQEAGFTIQLEVSDPEAAKLVLETLALEITNRNGNQFTLHTTNEVVPEIARALVKANIDVLELAKIHVSLEDRFLTLTNGGEKA
ncbi:bacitracin ABC transporter ATP-binding protein [Listeria floridensis FSL S10-1187]|uniref:Bacitracin ABC transporter ATP-binding protein n=1 Tax=Listeria floridensis FSL S10-1187 TaxID=1265817 RepID=A0ABN0RGE3_9LIST|nr:ABC transporter ATP-binding protein [Listeria floridensis]EUJ32840.1 bacitracin ABC transporter ATP-binding protein [Listeria floridensis FSL S10-1187]